MGSKKTASKAASRRGPAKPVFTTPYFAIAIFLLIIAAGGALLLYLTATLSLEERLLHRYPSFSPQPQVMAATINRSSNQPPENFPATLIWQKSGNFSSSQEISNNSIGSLKFVSFQSRIPTNRALRYYLNYLNLQSYEIMESSAQGLAWSIIAQRGRLSLDFHVQPAAEGSAISIYYREMK